MNRTSGMCAGQIIGTMNGRDDRQKSLTELFRLLLAPMPLMHLQLFPSSVALSCTWLDAGLPERLRLFCMNCAQP